MNPVMTALMGGKLVAGGSPPSAPAFGAEVMRTANFFNSNPTQAFALNAGVASGQMLVVIVLMESGQTVASATDDAAIPNTYTIDNTQARNGIRVTTISSQISSALTSANSVTVTWSAASNTGKGAQGFTLNNVSTVYGAVAAQDFNTNANLSPTASAASVLIGTVTNNTSDIPPQASATYGTLVGGAGYNYAGDGLFSATYYVVTSGSGVNKVGIDFASAANFTIQAEYYK